MIKFCLAIAVLNAGAVLGSNLADYKQLDWSDHSLHELFEKFAHVIHCETDTENLTCSQCLSPDVTKDLGSPLESHHLAVYLLNLYLSKDVYCQNSSDMLQYDQLVANLAIDSTTEETLETSLSILLDKVNSSYTQLMTEEHEETTHGDHVEPEEDKHAHDHEDHGHDHGGEEEKDHDSEHIHCFGQETLLHSQERDNSGHSAAEVFSYLIINHILDGDKLTSDCPPQPLEQDFISDILHQLELPENATHIPFADLEILVSKASGGDASTDEEDGHEGHDHGDEGHAAHKRSVDKEEHDHDHDPEHHHEEESLVEKCLTVEEIAEAFGVAHGESVPVDVLPDISLAVVQQLAGGYCTAPVTAAEPHSGPTSFQKWGLSTISVAIISSLALIGGLLFPCLNHDFVQDILTLFIGLAIGTMAGDALLHLLPQAVGLHDHEHAPSEGIIIEDYTWKMLVVIAAIYVFFLFETVMAKFGHSHLGDDDDHIHSKAHSKCTDKGVVPHAETMENIHLAVSGEKGVNNGYITSTAELTGSDSLSDDAEHMKKPQKSVVSWFKLPTVAYMVIVGDALHNFVDGLAIGAAFADGYEAGIAISIAVLCHELPHELGDFAVLLATGLTPKRVLLANFFCACCAFVGLYIGIAVSSNETTRQWIFAATAGMFLYVALVNMIPELARRKSKSTFRLFLLQNVGLIVGFACMFIIAVFEDHISFA